MADRLGFELSSSTFSLWLSVTFLSLGLQVSDGDSLKKLRDIIDTSVPTLLPKAMLSSFACESLYLNRKWKVFLWFLTTAKLSLCSSGFTGQNVDLQPSQED